MIRPIECSSKTATKNYAPLPIGNGDISALIDMEGVQGREAYHGMKPCVWRAGRRYDTAHREMIPFGRFSHGMEEKPKSWVQRLDVAKGAVETDCEYEGGKRIASLSFAHLGLPVIATRRDFKGPGRFVYTLSAPGGTKSLPPRMKTISSVTECGIDIAYEIDGLQPYHGAISILCERPAKASIDGNEFSLEVEDGPASFFIAFADSMDADDVTKASFELKELIRKEGFEGLFASHRQRWADYWKESYVKMPSRKEAEVYATAQYHLRISSTAWSMPVGIFPEHWNGRYFGFDEHFGFMGLATSGHLDVARKIPEFRFKTLPKARARAFSYFGEENGESFGAKYNWECDEGGDDRTPSGFWLEHIFNMAQIALSSWEMWRYGGEIEFLREKAYPVIASCAKFYEKQHLYEVDGGRLIVGKCTDLERLGAARENAFMTSCGVIATLEAAAKAAGILDSDAEKAKAWREKARRLKESLPRKNGRYVPYPGCEKKSIAVFAGSFPYHVLKADDPEQKAAVEDYLANENSFGNMYPVGNSVCVWYAAWKGIAFARLGNLAKAYDCVKQACREANCFSEIFEISSPAMHPWFTTAEGSFVQMLNESLLRSSEGEIEIRDYPGKDRSFKLAAVGGATLEAEFSDGAAKKLRVEAKRGYQGKISLPDGRSFELKLNPGESVELL